MVLCLPDPFPPMSFRHFLVLSDSCSPHLSPHMASSGLGIYKIPFKHPCCSPKLFYLLWENQISTINVRETGGIKPTYSGWPCYMDSQAPSTFYKSFSTTVDLHYYSSFRCTAQCLVIYIPYEVIPPSKFSAPGYY